MTSDKQQLLLEYLVSSPDMFTLCRSIVRSKFFNPEFRNAVDFLLAYHDKYNAIPSTEAVYAETSVSLKIHTITEDQVAFCGDEVEAFCKRKAIEHAIIDSAVLMKEGNYGKIEDLVRDAINTSLHRDIGISYFEDPEERLKKYEQTLERISTGYSDLDALIGGGLARTEILLVSAGSGGGKSITLANLALNFLKQPKFIGSTEKCNVIYFTFELSEAMVSQRFDMMLSGIPTMVHNAHQAEIIEYVRDAGVDSGELTIVYMPPDTPPSAIRSYLKEFQLRKKYLPDVGIFDYLDGLGTDEKISVDNIYQRDKHKTEKLRDIGKVCNMAIATASQQNRDAITSNTPNQGWIAGGLSKVNTVDWYLAIVFSEQMRAAGDIGFLVLKARSGDTLGKQAFLKWDNKRLRIINGNNSKQQQEDASLVENMAKISARGNNQSPKPRTTSLEELFEA